MDINSDIKRKIAKIVIASKRTLDPSFRQYWKDTATSLSTKYNVSLSEIENSSEYRNEIKTRSYY
jgi:hypothetical protein